MTEAALGPVKKGDWNATEIEAAPGPAKQGDWSEAVTEAAPGPVKKGDWAETEIEAALDSAARGRANDGSGVAAAISCATLEAVRKVGKGRVMSRVAKATLQGCHPEQARLVLAQSKDL